MRAAPVRLDLAAVPSVEVRPSVTARTEGTAG
jgi:hypothetical protein